MSRERRIASDSQRYKAMGLLVAAAILWSLGGLLIKLVSWHPLAIAGTRSGIAAFVLLAVLRRPRFAWSASRFGGAIAYAGTVILFVLANKLTTAANAIIIQYTAPVYVALLGAWLLGEHATWLDWATIFVAIGGMVLFFLDKLTTGGFWGNVCALLSGLSFACLVVSMRKQKDESPLESVFIGNLLTVLIGLPFILTSPAPGLSGWVGLGFLGVFQLGLSYILYSVAIKHVTALEATLVPVLEPILNPLWVFLTIGEAPGPWALLGGFLVLGSVTARCLIVALRQDVSQRGLQRKG